MSVRSAAESFLARLRGSTRQNRNKRRPSSQDLLAANVLDSVDYEVCEQCRLAPLAAHCAAYHGHIVCLRGILIDAPGKFHALDRNGATPLHLAVRQRQLEAVRWLLVNCPEQCTSKAKGGETPALVAAAQGSKDSLQVMFEVDSRLRQRILTEMDASGMTAIHLATLKNREECVAWMLKTFGGRLVLVQSHSSVTPVHIAAATGHVGILGLLLKKDKKGATQCDTAGTAPAYFAAQEGQLECLRYLVEISKVNPLSPCDDGMTTMHAAAQGGHLEVLKWLVDTQGNEIVICRTDDQATPVHFAAAMGHVECLKFLLSSRNGVVNVIDVDGGTPAHDAADNGKVGTLRVLQAHGAHLAAKDKDGVTPLMLALQSDNVECKEWARHAELQLPHTTQLTDEVNINQEAQLAGKAIGQRMAASDDNWRKEDGGADDLYAVPSVVREKTSASLTRGQALLLSDEQVKDAEHTSETVPVEVHGLPRQSSAVAPSLPPRTAASNELIDTEAEQTGGNGESDAAKASSAKDESCPQYEGDVTKTVQEADESVSPGEGEANASQDGVPTADTVGADDQQDKCLDILNPELTGTTTEESANTDLTEAAGTETGKEEEPRHMENSCVFVDETYDQHKERVVSPPALKGVVEKIKVAGILEQDCTKLRIRSQSLPDSASAPSSPRQKLARLQNLTRTYDSNPDVSDMPEQQYPSIGRRPLFDSPLTRRKVLSVPAPLPPSPRASTSEEPKFSPHTSTSGESKTSAHSSTSEESNPKDERPVVAVKNKTQSSDEDDSSEEELTPSPKPKVVKHQGRAKSSTLPREGFLVDPSRALQYLDSSSSGSESDSDD